VDFDWSTFALEVVNFLILVWLLKRFLYRPVLSMVEKRREAVQKRLQDAQQAREEARELQAQYEARGDQWERELAQRRRTLEEELEATRRKQLDALDAEIASERKRRLARLEREEASRQQSMEIKAAGQAATFAARLLRRLSGPDLDRHIVAAVIKDLGSLNSDARRAITAALEAGEEVTVASASDLPDADRGRLQQAFAAFGTTAPKMHYITEPDLLGGLRIRIDAWELDASLDGELRTFAESSRHD
jgi:F-type H+-transporting ATPase subunit b